MDERIVLLRRWLAQAEAMVETETTLVARSREVWERAKKMMETATIERDLLRDLVQVTEFRADPPERPF